MNAILRNALALAAVTLATQAAAQATFYENEGYSGRTFTANAQIGNLGRYGFNDRVSSVVVQNEPWQVCDDAHFNGRCVVLRPGNYPSLAAMGMNDRISSVRAVNGYASNDVNPYLPQPVADNDYHRHHNERLFEANVVAVHAVVGPPEQRCWVENEQITEHRNKVPGAIVGALIGGILGHQVGGGSGRDFATAGGAVAGAAVGANIGGHSGGQVSNRDVQRCENVPSQARPEYWDVTYTFQGQEHYVQLTAPPGPTVTVNERGEPRE